MTSASADDITLRPRQNLSLPATNCVNQCHNTHEKELNDHTKKFENLFKATLTPAPNRTNKIKEIQNKTIKINNLYKLKSHLTNNLKS